MLNEFLIYEDRPGIEVVFSNGQDLFSLFYVIYEWPSAIKFYNLIDQCVSKKTEFTYDTSFNIKKSDEIKLIDRINFLIISINFKYNLNLALINETSNLNTLHRDVVLANCELWTEINDLIHAYEQYKTQLDLDPRINAYIRFHSDDSIPLEHEDFLFFKPDRNFGDLCLNYTHKGKHWLELQTDNDTSAITDGQLHPENKIAPSAYLLFRPPFPSPFYRLNKFVSWFKETLPGSKITPEMAIGYLLVGKLVMPPTWESFFVEERSNWVRMLSNYKNILEIKTTHITANMVPELLIKSRMVKSV